MSIGFVGADYGGSLVPARTAPVVFCTIGLTGNNIDMIAASQWGDVVFDGKLSANATSCAAPCPGVPGGSASLVLRLRFASSGRERLCPTRKTGICDMLGRVALHVLLTAFLVALPVATRARSVEDRFVAVTFDDLPYANASASTREDAVRANSAIRRALKVRRVPAIGFVTEQHARTLGRTGRDLLRAWLRDGHELGNHGATHADINLLDLDDIRREIVDGEATIRPLAVDTGAR